MICRQCFFFPDSKGFIMKYFAYANDITLTLSKTYSISRALELLNNFGKPTGLKLNYKKTKRISMLQRGALNLL